MEINITFTQKVIFSNFTETALYLSFVLETTVFVLKRARKIIEI